MAATPKAIAKNINLHIDDVPSLPKVMMQSSRIIQLMSNLIGNAIKFTPEHGRVTVSARLTADGQRLRLSVMDTGCGIPESAVPTLFERFTQVDESSTRTHGGAGLGLAIARDLSKAMGGDLKLGATGETGTEFHVLLAE